MDVEFYLSLVWGCKNHLSKFLLMLTSLKFQINEQHNLKLGMEPRVRKTKCSHWLGNQDWFITQAIILYYLD